MSGGIHLSLALTGLDDAIDRFVRLMRHAARAEGYGNRPDPTFSTLPFLEESGYLPWRRLAATLPDPDDSDLPNVDAEAARSLAQHLLRPGYREIDPVLNAVQGSHPVRATPAARPTTWHLDGFSPPDEASWEWPCIRYAWHDARRNFGVILDMGSQLERLGLTYVIRASDAYPLYDGNGKLFMEYFVQMSDRFPQTHVDASDAGAQFVRFLLELPDDDMDRLLRAWYGADADLPDDLAADPGATFRAIGWQLVSDWRNGRFDFWPV